mgnify:CR=1 FL=1
MTSITRTREQRRQAASVKIGNLARVLVERMGVSFTPTERGDGYGFLFKKLWIDFSSERVQAIEAEVQQSTLAKVTQHVERWQTYTDQAARFIAALRAVIS